MWYINEELWLHRSELSTHISCGFPPLMQLVRHGEGQYSVIFLDLAGRLKKKIKPSERLPDSCSRYLATAISDKWLMCSRGMSLFCLLIRFIPTLKKKKRTIFHFPSSCSKGGGYNANGHSPGTPGGRKASNHINPNSWPFPEGWLLTDGGELCVMCLTYLKLTQINLCPSHYWLQGSAIDCLMITVKNNSSLISLDESRHGY